MGSEAGEIAALRERIDYSGQRIADSPELLRNAADRAADVMASADRAQVVRTRLSDPTVHAALSNAYECITLLVGTELDTTTSGERGLGRLSTQTPRLGGKFRERLTPDVGSTLGRVMEDLCIGGFATSVIYDVLLPDGPATVRSRSVEEVLPAWVGHIAIAFDDAAQSFLDIAFAVVEDSYDAFLAEADVLTHGLRKKSQLKDLNSVARFLVGAGADLYFYVSSRTDDRF